MNKKARLPALPYPVWMVGFTVIPFALVLVFGPTDRNDTFTLDNAILIVERNHPKALKPSLLFSFVSMLICLLLAFLLALILRSKKIGCVNFVVFVFILPMWMNFLLRILAWQTLLEKNGMINGILGALHLPPIAVISTPIVIVFGMVYNFLSFMVLPLYSTMCKIEDSVVGAARDLDAPSPQTLWCIWLPLSAPGIVSGVTMVFILVLTTFVISNTLGGSRTPLISNVIEIEFTKASNWDLGSGLSTAILIFILFSMTVLAHYDKNGEGTTS